MLVLYIYDGMSIFGGDQITKSLRDLKLMCQVAKRGKKQEELKLFLVLLHSL